MLMPLAQKIHPTAKPGNVTANLSPAYQQSGENKG
jgi:hypothetical protein